MGIRRTLEKPASVANSHSCASCKPTAQAPRRPLQATASGTAAGCPACRRVDRVMHHVGLHHDRTTLQVPTLSIAPSTFGPVQIRSQGSCVHLGTCHYEDERRQCLQRPQRSTELATCTLGRGEVGRVTDADATYVSGCHERVLLLLHAHSRRTEPTEIDTVASDLFRNV